MSVTGFRTLERSWLLGIAISVALPSIGVEAAPVPPEHSCMGLWVGEGRNTGYDTPWTIGLTLTASPDGGRCGTIEYTNPNCGGTLENCRLVGDDIHTVERYTHRDANCAPEGRVIIRCEGEQMRYAWLGWERVDTILHRPGASPSEHSSAPSSPATPTDLTSDQRPGQVPTSVSPSQTGSQESIGCAFQPCAVGVVARSQMWRPLLILAGLALVAGKRIKSRSTVNRSR